VPSSSAWPWSYAANEPPRNDTVSRGALVTLLLVAAGLLIPIALIGVWTHQVLLDRERFTNLSDDLLEQPAVRRGLADKIVDQAEDTPGSRVSGAQPALRAGIESVLTTAEYRLLFRQSVGDAHDQLTSDQDQLELDVGPAVDLARRRIPGANALPPGSQVPPIELADRDDIPVLWGAVDAAQRVALITPLVVLALLALAVAMARRRWLAMGAAGAVLAGVSLLVLGLIALARQVVGRRVGAVVERDAFDAAWDVIARSLVNTTLIIVLGAAVVSAGGFVVHFILTRRPAPAYGAAHDGSSI
jgi:hypothetical protein